MNDEARRILENEVMDESVPFENGMGTVEKLDNQELLFSELDIVTELPSLDAHIVRESFAGNTLAGDDIEYTFSYGQLRASIKGYKIKGQTFKAMLKEIYTDYFDRYEAKSIDDKWSLVSGELFPSGSSISGSFLFRGETMIGFFKEGTDVSRTIKWYESKIYGNTRYRFNKTHTTVDFRPEIPHDVYDKQQPEFTKELELEEIRLFITSLRRRVLSNEEREIIKDIDSQIGLLGSGTWIELSEFTDEEIENEYYNRQQD